MKQLSLESIRKIAYKGFITLWASAIFWFYLGNLVNFHQNRIWGKYLIPSCFTHSSVNKQDFGSLQSDDYDTLINYDDYGFDMVATIEVQPLTPVTLDIDYSGKDDSNSPVTDPLCSAIGLRGPPVA